MENIKLLSNQEKLTNELQNELEIFYKSLQDKYGTKEKFSKYFQETQTILNGLIRNGIHGISIQQISNEKNEEEIQKEMLRIKNDLQQEMENTEKMVFEGLV